MGEDIPSSSGSTTTEIAANTDNQANKQATDNIKKPSSPADNNDSKAAMAEAKAGGEDDLTNIVKDQAEAFVQERILHTIKNKTRHFTAQADRYLSHFGHH